jgi:hypothetical protein
MNNLDKNDPIIKNNNISSIEIQTISIESIYFLRKTRDPFAAKKLAKTRQRILLLQVV